MDYFIFICLEHGTAKMYLMQALLCSLLLNHQSSHRKSLLQSRIPRWQERCISGNILACSLHKQCINLIIFESLKQTKISDKYSFNSEAIRSKEISARPI